MDYQIVLDVGGTGIKGRLCNGRQFIGGGMEFPSRSDADRKTLIPHLCSICEAVLGQAPTPYPACSSIAMAFPGPFDYSRGIPLMQGLAKYESLYGVVLPEEIDAHWHSRSRTEFERVRWHFINDVSAFALGAVEKNGLLGRTMCVCLGTGAGSAFCIGEQLCVDTAEGVPENGWIYPLPFHGTMIDDVLSARGIIKIAEKHCQTGLTPLELCKEAENGSHAAADAWQEYGELLREALMPIATAFRANALILGGKIAMSAQHFMESLSRQCAERNITLLIETDTSLLTERGLLKV